MSLVAPCHLAPVRDDNRRSMIYPRAVVVDEDDQQNQERVGELELLILRTYYSCNAHMYMNHAYVSM